MKKYFSVFFVLAAIIVITASFTLMPPADDEVGNLKVLPKNITDQQLDSVMDHFKLSLGVKCGFCHAQQKDTSADRHLDFASDEKPEKIRAREMLQMTAYLNATYFNPDHSTRPDTIHEVICYTCHRGGHDPGADMLFPQLDSLMMLQHQRKK